MKKHLLLFSFLCLFLTGYSQSGTQPPKLVFTFDQAGNQTHRQYCEGDCQLAQKNADENAISELDDFPIAEQFDELVIMYPNPTTGILKLKWDQDLRGVVQKVQLFNYQGRLLHELSVAELQQATLNLSNYPTGAYIAKFVFTDASIHSKQIIKN